MLTLTNTTTSPYFPAVSSLTGALNINDAIAGMIALHATGNSTVAGTVGLDQSLNGYSPFTVDAGATMTVSAQATPVSGASYGGINKLGGGSLLLTNSSNTYVQGLQINGGTVQFTNNALHAASRGQGGYTADFLANSTLRFDPSDTTDISSGGEIHLADGVAATFDTNGSTQTFAAAFALNSGTASVVVNDSSATPGKLIFAANNTYTGGTTITRGTLQVGNGGSTGSVGTGAIVDNGALAYNFSSAAQLALPPAAGLSGTGNLNVVTPTTAFVGNVTLGGSQTYNPGNAAAAYNVSTSATLTGSSISITGELDAGANSGNTLTLNTSAANGPITLNLGFSVPNVSYTLAASPPTPAPERSR